MFSYPHHDLAAFVDGLDGIAQEVADRPRQL